MVQGAFPKKEGKSFRHRPCVWQGFIEWARDRRRFSAFITESFKRLNASIQGDLCRGMALNVETK